jgi:hypothetical protein
VLSRNRHRWHLIFSICCVVTGLGGLMVLLVLALWGQF